MKQDQLLRLFQQIIADTCTSGETEYMLTLLSSPHEDYMKEEASDQEMREAFGIRGVELSYQVRAPIQQLIDYAIRGTGAGASVLASEEVQNRMVTDVGIAKIRYRILKSTNYVGDALIFNDAEQLLQHCAGDSRYDMATHDLLRDYYVHVTVWEQDSPELQAYSCVNLAHYVSLMLEKGKVDLTKRQLH